MNYTGTVYKFNNNYGFIQPDDRKGPRKDVLFDKKIFAAKIGDRVKYSWIEKEGRRFAEEMEIIEKKHRVYG